jgi:hypothetical protein
MVKVYLEESDWSRFSKLADYEDLSISAFIRSLILRELEIRK